MKGAEIMKTSTIFNCITVLVFGALVLGTGLPAFAADTVDPIEPGPETVLPDYIGSPAKPHPSPNSGVPQNPFLAPNPFNMVHMDPWNSDVVDIASPLGRDPVTFSSTLADARRDSKSKMFECVSSAFTSHGHLILSCFGVDEASVALIDPETLKVYDHYELPVTLPEDVGDNPQQSALTNGLSASYWLFDEDEHFTLSIKDETKNNKIITLVEGGSDASPTLERDQEYDMSKWVSANNRISGLAMDWQGRIWFYLSGSSTTTDSPGIPGAIYVFDPALYPADEAVKFYEFEDQDEQIRNSLAITRTGVYVVTSKKMYRLGFDANGDLKPVWEEEYENAGYIKPGQYNAGSGTTPTILGKGKYVAITDNADPTMHVVVYRTEEQLEPNESRIVCEVPVFVYAEGGALDNSLLGSDLSLIAENNYGYQFDFKTMTSSKSEPGFERIDIDPNGRGCTKVWVNTEIASTASAKLSTRTGLIYTYARKHDDDNDVWVYYWTALDFHTGEVVWQKMAGNGQESFDTIWPTVYVGPNETLYVGLLGGLAAMRDTK
jgi:hypothetical protein